MYWKLKFFWWEIPRKFQNFLTFKNNMSNKILFMYNRLCLYSLPFESWFEILRWAFRPAFPLQKIPPGFRQPKFLPHKATAGCCHRLICADVQKFLDFCQLLSKTICNTAPWIFPELNKHFNFKQKSIKKVEKCTNLLKGPLSFCWHFKTNTVQQCFDFSLLFRYLI